MTREDRIKLSRNRRAFALARNEFREPSAPRKSPAGIISAPIKVEDAATRKLIDEALARRDAR